MRVSKLGSPPDLKGCHKVREAEDVSLELHRKIEKQKSSIISVLWSRHNPRCSRNWRIFGGGKIELRNAGGISQSDKISYFLRQRRVCGVYSCR